METSAEMLEVIYGCLWKIEQIMGSGALFGIQPFMCLHDTNHS